MKSSLLNNKRVAKNTIFLYGRMLFSMIISLYTVRIVLNTLGASDYGLYNVVGGIIAVFGVLKALISTGTQRFLTYEMGKGAGIDRLTAVFCTSLSTFLMIGVAIFILGETFGLWFVNTYLNIPEGREFATNAVYQVSIVSMFISVIQLPYSAAILSHERMDIYGYVGIGEPLFRLFLIVLLPFLPYDKLITYSIMILVISGTVTLAYVKICNKLFDECKFKLKIDKPLFKNMIGFTIWNMLESISNMLNGQGLDILINLFFGTTVNASRAIANRVNHSVHGFAGNFIVALVPQITKTYASREYEECYKLILRGSKFAYIIIAILILPIILNMDSILDMWLKTYPADASIFCILVLIAMMVRMISEPLYTGIQATGHVKNYQIWTSSITLLNIPICFVLYKMGYPAYMAFYVTIVMSFVLLICRLLFLRKLTNFPSRRYLKIVFVNCFGVTMIAFIPLYIINGLLEHNFTVLIIMTMLSVLWTGVLFLFLSITKGERTLLFDFVKSKIKKL